MDRADDQETHRPPVKSHIVPKGGSITLKERMNRREKWYEELQKKCGASNQILAIRAQASAKLQLQNCISFQIKFKMISNQIQIDFKSNSN